MAEGCRSRSREISETSRLNLGGDEICVTGWYVNQILLQTTHILESLPDACRYSRRQWAVCYSLRRYPRAVLRPVGSFSVETIFTLFALKCACPLWIHLARGNHESRSLNKVHGFENRGGPTEGKGGSDDTG
ncbi:hypothetical protein YC2023_034895 [Brassica napus]